MRARTEPLHGCMRQHPCVHPAALQLSHNRQQAHITNFCPFFLSISLPAAHHALTHNLDIPTQNKLTKPLGTHIHPTHNTFVAQRLHTKALSPLDRRQRGTEFTLTVAYKASIHDSRVSLTSTSRTTLLRSSAARRCQAAVDTGAPTLHAAPRTVDTSTQTARCYCS